MVYDEFSEWLDDQLCKDLPQEVVAFNFNLYEGLSDSSECPVKQYHIELIGADCFDEDDEDWPCNEVFTTRDNLFIVERTKDIMGWKKGLGFVTSLVTKYLQEGKYAGKLKSAVAVGIGFVDGDITILYHREED